MHLFLLAHEPVRGNAFVLSQNMKNWVATQSIGRCVVFRTGPVNENALVTELQTALPETQAHIDVVELPSINTKDAKGPHDLYAQPWRVLTTIIRQMELGEKGVVLTGRSNALVDHLLWLAAQCFSDVDVMDIDALEIALDPTLNEISGEKTPNTVAGLLEFHIQDLISQRSDEAVGYSDAARLSTVPGAGLNQGISAALQTLITNGFVGRTEVTEGSVTYNLLPAGLAAAAAAWQDNRGSPEPNSKTLNIIPFRLPTVHTKRKNAPARSFDEFFWFMRPLQPVDGLITVLQRHDDELGESCVCTLNEAIERFSENEAFIGDLRHSLAVLQRRSQEDGFEMNNHLLVINPKATVEFQFEFVLKLLSACVSFEQQHGKRIWSIDNTMALTNIRSALSFFSFIFQTATTYILKEDVDGKKVTDLSKRSLKVPVPNALAHKTLSTFTDPHKLNKGGPNILIGLLMWESIQKTEDTDGDFNPYEEDLDDEDDFGVTPKTLHAFIEGCKSELDLTEGLGNIHRTIKKNQLIEQGLVKHDGKLKRYALTDLGVFVATQLELLRRWEVAN